MTEITEAEAPIVVPDSRAVDKSFQNVTSSQSPENTRSLLDGPSVGVEAPSSTLKNLDDDALISRALQLEKLIQSRIQVKSATFELDPHIFRLRLFFSQLLTA